jgi:hypothetical protein
VEAEEPESRVSLATYALIAGFLRLWVCLYYPSPSGYTGGSGSYPAGQAGSPTPAGGGGSQSAGGAAGACSSSDYCSGPTGVAATAGIQYTGGHGGDTLYGGGGGGGGKKSRLLLGFIHRACSSLLHFRDF